MTEHLTTLPVSVPLDGFAMAPTEPQWALAASIICGHDFVQAWNEDQQAEFHSFVREVLRTTGR
jgi:hypothetical protein